MLQPCFKLADWGDPSHDAHSSAMRTLLQIWVINHDGNLHQDSETTVRCFKKMLGKEDGD